MEKRYNNFKNFELIDEGEELFTMSHSERTSSVPAKLTTKQAILGAVLAYISLIISQLAAVLVSQGIVRLGVPSAVGSAISGILYIVLAFLCVSLICRKCFKLTMNSCRITKVSVKPVWGIAALILPCIIVFIYFMMPGNLKNTVMNAGELCYTITDAVIFYGLAAGIVEEVIFRGVIMSALEQRWNRYIAVIVPSVIFALSHVIGADLNFVSILQLLVAGSMVGIMFSLITYESGNIWNSALMHIIWNIVMIGGILHIGVEENKYFLFNYVLDSHSFAITGGDFGIEASVIAIMGYLIF